VAARSVALKPLSGRVVVRTPGAKKRRTLRAAEVLPMGTYGDVTRGRLAVTARTRAGNRTATVSGGRFTITQSAGVTVLRLARDRTCRKPNALWNAGSASFGTRGRTGSAVGRGGRWLTREQCGGTYFRSARGTVMVRDLVRHKTKHLNSHKSYLARR